MNQMNQDTKICVVGLGYVGLPLACLLSQKYKVFGFDVNENKVKDLKNGIDQTREVSDLSKCHIEYSIDPKTITQANFIIIAVPTPIQGESKEPDLTFLKDASTLVGQNLSDGSIVVYESTVYPGATQEVCLPILEKESGGKDFKIGYSPERVNPGDKEHTIDKITKVVSGSDQEALEKIAEVYGSITKVHKASSIKVAEAAKVIENVQRDLNIALMNELALIFDRLEIDTKEVIEAAGTKWNFNKYYPGLVGGHCIGIDPYYLTYKAKEVGYDPKIILAGRGVNESMVNFVADKFQDKNSILIMGMTFKENVPDLRNSKAQELLSKLESQGKAVVFVDPIINRNQTLPAKSEADFDGVIVFSPHDEFKNKEYSLDNLKKICTDNAILFDVKGFYDKIEAEKLGFKYLTL